MSKSITQKSKVSTVSPVVGDDKTERVPGKGRPRSLAEVEDGIFKVFTPSQEDARKRYLELGGTGESFQHYALRGGVGRDSVLRLLGEFAIKHHLLEACDLDRFMTTNPADHERLPKEMDTVRVFATHLADSFLSFYCYPSNVLFTRASEEVRNPLVPVVRQASLACRALELSVGLIPLDPNTIQEWSNSTLQMIEKRRTAVQDFQKEVNGIASQFNSYRQFKLAADGKRYYTGNFLQDFDSEADFEGEEDPELQKAFSSFTHEVWSAVHFNMEPHAQGF